MKLKYIENEDLKLALENNQSFVSKKDMSVRLDLERGAICYLSSWLIEKCSSQEPVYYNNQEFPKVIVNMAEIESKMEKVNISKTFELFDYVDDNSFLLQVKSDTSVSLFFELQKGEKLDFSDPSNHLFFNKDKISFLTSTPDKEKDKLSLETYIEASKSLVFVHK